MNDRTTTMTSTNVCTDSANFDETMKLVGDFWTLRLVDAIRDDEQRFCEIERRIPEISPATLTNRLKKLEEAGVVERRLGTLDRQSVSYVLTAYGAGMLPVLESIRQFTAVRPA